MLTTYDLNYLLRQGSGIAQYQETTGALDAVRLVIEHEAAPLQSNNNGAVVRPWSRETGTVRLHGEPWVRFDFKSGYEDIAISQNGKNSAQLQQFLEMTSVEEMHIQVVCNDHVLKFKREWDEHYTRTGSRYIRDEMIQRRSKVLRGDITPPTAGHANPERYRSAASSLCLPDQGPRHNQPISLLQR